jgi:hypothetical protein
MKKTVRFAAPIGSMLFIAMFVVAVKAQNVTNVTQATNFTTLQAAINAANDGDEIRVNNDIAEGLIVVDKDVEIFSQAPAKTITSTSGTWGIQIASSGVLIRRLNLQNAGTFGIITKPGVSNLEIRNVTVSNCGGSGFAITCVDNVMLNNITSNSNGGNAVSITDCDNVTIDGITTDGENKFSSLAPFSGGIGIFSSGLFCTPGVDGVTITGAVDIQDFVALYEQATSGTISNVTYTPTSGSPAELPFYVGSTLNNKAYVQNLTDAYECAASLIAAGLSPKEDVFINEIATGSKYVDDNLAPLAIPGPPDPQYPVPGNKTLCITTAILYSNAGDSIFVAEGNYPEQVIIDKSVVVLGPNAALDPCAAFPSSAAVIFPTEVGGNLITVEASDVTIAGLTLNGDNDTITSGFVANAADIDADYGIRVEECYNNLVVNNNYILNIKEVGIELMKNTPDCASVQNGIEIKTNRIFNVPGGQGFGIEIRMKANASIDDNCIDACQVGVRFANEGAGTVTNNFFGEDAVNLTDVLIRNNAGLVDCDGKNSFSGTTFGVQNLSATEVDAQNNYWGDGVGGPSGEGAGTGAPVSTNVEFCPWLDAAPPAGMPVTNCTPIAITGKIIHSIVAPTGTTGVDSIEVILTVDDNKRDTTDNDGNYFLLPDMGTNFTLTPVALPPPVKKKYNGVTAADVTRIQKHITGNPLLTPPYFWIAADVNKSNSITTADAAIIQQALKGNITAEGLFPTSWRFVPTTHMFPPASNNPMNAFWMFPEKLDITVTPFVPSLNNNFYGIKIGDVTGDSDPLMRPDQQTPFVLRMADQMLAVGSEVRVDVSIEGFVDIAAFQCALDFDQNAMRFVGLETATNGSVTEDDFGTFHAAEGKLRAVMARVNGVSFAEGAQHFTLRFEALQSGLKLSEVMRLNEDELLPRAYTNELLAQPLVLAFGATTSNLEPGAEALYLTVRPNPATDRTIVHFNMPQAGDASISLYDATGRLVSVQNSFFPAGINDVPVSFDNAAGLMMIELKTADGVRTVKVVAK